MADGVDNPSPTPEWFLAGVDLDDWTWFEQPATVTAVYVKSGFSTAASREGTGSGTVVLETHANIWFATPAAITRVTVLCSAGNIATGSRLTINGLN
jgi:hypothetical protein